MTTAVSPVTTVHKALCSQTLLLDIILYVVRWNDHEIETSLKAVGSLQRCINIKTPTLRFDFEILILLFHFNRDSIIRHYRLPFTRLESADSLI